MDKKYELIESDIKGLYRVKALKDFGDVKKGDIGGYVENPNNLSHKGYCWVYDDAKVYNEARICGNAQVSNCAVIDGNAQIHGDSEVLGYAIIRDNALIYGDSVINGNAFIGGYTEIKTGCHIGCIEEKFRNVLYIQCKASLITIYKDINNVIKCNIGCQKRITLEGLLKRIEEDGGMNEHGKEYVRIMQNAHLLLG